MVSMTSAASFAGSNRAPALNLVSLGRSVGLSLPNLKLILIYCCPNKLLLGKEIVTVKRMAGPES